MLRKSEQGSYVIVILGFYLYKIQIFSKMFIEHFNYYLLSTFCLYDSWNRTDRSTELGISFSIKISQEKNDLRYKYSNRHLNLQVNEDEKTICVRLALLAVNTSYYPHLLV